MKKFISFPDPESGGCTHSTNILVKRHMQEQEWS